MSNRKFMNIFLLSMLALITISCKTEVEKYSPLWDRDYLLNHPEISKLINQYQNGYICQELKTIRTDLLPHSELSSELKNKGYKCESKPLYFSPNGKDSMFLTKTGEATLNKNNKDIVYQEIWSKGHCVVRIKPSGFPGNRRSYPHANKAVVIDPSFYSYGNEAFKITNNAVAVPKSPGQDVGMAKCNDDPIYCKQKVDDVMSDLHPILLSPSPDQFCNSN